MSWWLLGLGVALFAAPAHAEDLSKPTFHSFAGAFLIGDTHNFFVESELQLPLLQLGPFSLDYHHQESTPFLSVHNGIQAEQLYNRDELQADWQLTDWLRVITLGGYHVGYLEDRPGKAEAVAIGGGLGSPAQRNGNRFYWHALAGGYMAKHELNADWWTDLYGSWRAFYFVTDEYLGSKFRASLNLSMRAESANEDDHYRSLYKGGPEIELLTANGNRAIFELHWYRNDHNPFYGSQENGLLVGLDITSSREDDYLYHARQTRQPGWFPMIWGDYDAGVGGTRRVTRFEMNVEVVDFRIADHLGTFAIWYQTHQEFRDGDFDNISYSVALGLQTPIGLASPLSQGNPLVLGLDFLHRSDHSLNPNADRVAAVGVPTSLGPMIAHGSLNIWPRLRLQTLGWDLPYRDPTMYERRTAWLNFVDWRLTAGHDASSSRNRFPLAAQIGLNWDIATIQGFVVYTQGIASTGNETPDWLAELGVRRPVGKLFTRFETYGINRNIARGDILEIGAGINL